MKKAVLVLVTALLFGTFGNAQTFNSDPTHTFSVFRIMHAGIGYTYGSFDEISGVLNYDADDISNSSFSFEIIVDSVDTNSERRDGHLTSPDFFDSAQFPTIDFSSTSVAAGADEGTFVVTGDLSIHGVTNEVTVDVIQTGEGSNRDGKMILGYHTTFDIDRTEYGMDNLLQAAGETVTIMLSFEGIEQ